MEERTGKANKSGDPKIAAASATSGTGSTAATNTTPSTPTVPRLLAETKQILSALNGNPALRPLRVLEAEMKKVQTLLLDSGATHLLRQAKSQEEMDKANPVIVTLAGDEGKVLKQLDSGTIVTDPDGETPQPIIPLGQLTEVLGCKASWERGPLQGGPPRNGDPQGTPPKWMSRGGLPSAGLLERNTKDLEARLFSLTLEEDKCWTDLLHNTSTRGPGKMV